MKMNNSGKWNVSRTETFWRDIAPGEHVLQIYENTEIFVNTLAAFVGTGINAGESVIVIAFPEHKKLLEDKLRQHVLQLDTLKDDGRYIQLDAKETLDAFMVNGWPDREKFYEVIGKVVKTARGRENRKVRAFGEMVAILWEKGDRKATLELEQIWDEYCNREKISLFCAYPKDIFQGPIHEQLNHICTCHTKIIRDTDKALTQVVYQEVRNTV